MITYYNYFAIISYLAIILLFLIKRPCFLNISVKWEISPAMEKVLFFSLLALGVFLRFYRLSTLPEGFHQDEASNSYEAFALANYGIDRNGYPYPVYPITFGSGGGSPVLIYLYAIICKFISPSVFAYRSIFATLGSLTLILFYFFLKKVKNSKTALFGMAVLSFAPWHVVLSRWGLDSNMIPFFSMLILLGFLISAGSKKTSHYIITAILSAFILYCYGSATFVMPFFLLFACGYCLYTGRLTVKQMFLSGIAFLITALPLAIFYFINVFDLPAIITPFFSFAKFTGNHTDSVFLTFDSSFFPSLFENIIHLLKMVTIGTGDELWNYVPGYFTLFHFTFPLTFLGIFIGIREVVKSLKQKEFSPHAIFLSMLLSATMIALLMSQNINRIVFLFLPLIYFMAMGMDALIKYSRYLTAYGILLIGIGGLFFTKDYFTEYGPMSNYLFMKGYGDAIVFAESIREEDDMIYSTYENLASPFLTALLYSRTSPYDFVDTVVYKEDGAEFNVASSFTHYVFGFPEDIEDEKYKEHILIISNMEMERFAPLGYESKEFGNFTVLW